MNRKNVLDEIKQGILDGFYDIERKYEYIEVGTENTTIEDLFEEKPPEFNEGYILTNLFNTLQGVTIGGEGSTAIFSNFDEIDKKNDLIFKCIGGRNITKNKISWSDEYMIFPYVIDDKFIPAFYDVTLKEDTLNFDVNIDESEEGKERGQKLTYRVARGYIQYPRIAEYLHLFYNDLYYREFEGKHILDYNKYWYEFHRPRKPAILSCPKIVFRRLMKDPSFAIDEEGYLPKDSVISLIPKEEFVTFLGDLKTETKEDISTLDGYHYILSFLNSDLFSALLEQKRAKKKGGYPIVGNSMLRNVIIPFPSSMNRDELIKRITSA